MSSTKQSGKQGGNKSNKSLILISVAVILLLIIVGRAGSGKGTDVSVVSPITKTITEIIPANGKIQPVVEVKISPDVSGEIVELCVEEGNRVSKGDLLLKIKQDSYISMRDRAAAALKQAESQLQQQESSHKLAEKTYNRNVSVYDKAVISPAEYEKVVADFEISKAQLKAAQYSVESAKASLAEAEDALLKTTIYAPMDGIVSRLTVERGERVVGTSQMAGTEMMRISDLSRMEVLVDVNENDIVRIKENDKATVEVDAYPNRQFTGTVTQIANSAKNLGTTLEQVTNFEVKILLDSDSYNDLIEKGNSNPFRPGMSASVSIQTQTHENALAIPIQCITTRADLIPDSLKFTLSANETLEQVFVIKNGKAKCVRVTSGIQDHNHIEILSGLNADDKVVTGPYTAISKHLDDGDKVNIKAKVKDKEEEN